MANISLNFGDIATRIRRFARAVGTISTDLQPTSVPTVLLQDLSQVPYAQEPRTAVGITGAGAAAGLSSYGCIQAAPGTVFIVDQIWISPETAAATVNVFIDRDITFPTPTFTISRVGLNTLNVAATGIHLEAITQAQVSGANTFINPGSGTLLFTLWNAAGTATPINQFVLPEPIVLFGSLPGPAPNSTSVTGDCLFAGSNGTLNVPITVQFWGREYTLLQGFR